MMKGEYRSVSLEDFEKLLLDFSDRNHDLHEIFNSSQVLRQIQPHGTSGFLLRYNENFDFLKTSLKHLNNNLQISKKNQRHERVEFDCTPFVIFEMVLTRLFQAFLSERRMIEEVNELSKVLTPLREMVNIFNQKTIHGILLIRYGEIEEDERAVYCSKEKTAEYRINQKIEETRYRTKQLSECMGLDPDFVEKLRAKEELAVEKYTDELIYYRAPISYAELSERYERMFQTKMRAPQQLIIMPPPRRESPAPRRLPLVLTEESARSSMNPIYHNIPRIRAPEIRMPVPSQVPSRASRLPLFPEPPLPEDTFPTVHQSPRVSTLEEENHSSSDSVSDAEACSPVERQLGAQNHFSEHCSDNYQTVPSTNTDGSEQHDPEIDEETDPYSQTEQTTFKTEPHNFQDSSDPTVAETEDFTDTFNPVTSDSDESQDDMRQDDLLSSEDQEDDRAVDANSEEVQNAFDDSFWKLEEDTTERPEQPENSFSEMAAPLENPLSFDHRDSAEQEELSDTDDGKTEIEDSESVDSDRTEHQSVESGEVPRNVVETKEKSPEADAEMSPESEAYSKNESDSVETYPGLSDSFLLDDYEEQYYDGTESPVADDPEENIMQSELTAHSSSTKSKSFERNDFAVEEAHSPEKEEIAEERFSGLVEEESPNADTAKKSYSESTSEEFFIPGLSYQTEGTHSSMFQNVSNRLYEPIPIPQNYHEDPSVVTERSKVSYIDWLSTPAEISSETPYEVESRFEEKQRHEEFAPTPVPESESPLKRSVEDEEQEKTPQKKVRLDSPQRFESLSD